MFLACLLWFSLLLLSTSHAQDGDPEVDTVYGTVRGKAISLSSGSVIDAYLGIPYAKAPVGNLRFEVMFFIEMKLCMY